MLSGSQRFFWVVPVLLLALPGDWAVAQSSDAARLSLSPGRVSFGTVGTELTGEKTLKVRNSGKDELRVEVLRWGLADREDFSQQNNCGAGLAAGEECVVTLSFSPLTEGVKSTTLEVVTSAGSKVVELSGKAQGPKLSANPRSVKFSSQGVGSTSAVKAITVKNSGKGVLRMATVTRRGDEAAQFTQTNTCGGAIEPKGSCRIEVGFAPSRGGDIRAELVLASNAGESVLALQGKGFQAEPKLALSPAKLSFRNQGTEVDSTEKKVTVRNKGTAPLVINLVRREGEGAEAFSQRNTCGAPVEPKGSCEIWLTFTPAQAVNYEAQLQLETNAGAGGALPVIGLSGNGVGPKISVKPSRLRFESEAVGTAVPPQAVTIQNTGKGLLRIASVRRAGEGAAAFAQNNNCGRALAPKASCVVNVSFYPASVDAVTAVLQVMHNAAPSMSEVSLSGAAKFGAKAISRTEAFRFLQQATFGPTEKDIAELMAMGDSTTAYERWIDAQLLKPVSLQLPALVATVPPSPPMGFNIPMRHRDRVEKWFEHALWGEDQLRQRVAWALSQIFVVSDAGVLDGYPFATADFYDMLARQALGNYRDLLESVTLHPAMGLYLSHLGNRRAQPGTNLRPDENYAREMMQLFSIGLVHLEPDGRVKRNAAGQPISTYNPEIISGFARVFTGWHWQCPKGIQWINGGGDRYTGNCDFNNIIGELLPVMHTAAFNQVLPMRLYPEEHEPGTKQLLTYPGVRLPGGTIPAGQGGIKDLSDALDNVFYHPNVGPFISKQLIQRLVTSNPTPDYIESVTSVFNNDGRGERGNLSAVVRAILMHPEARNAPSGQIAGKLKEPILRLTQFWRAYDVQSESGKFDLDVFCCALAEFGSTLYTLAPSLHLGQSPNQSPSVFNFYTPSFSPPGEISQAGLVAPELQLATEHLQTRTTSLFYGLVISDSSRIRATERGSREGNDIYYVNDYEWDNAYDDEKLISMVSKKLLGDPQAMSPSLRKAIRARLERLERYWQPGDTSFEGKGMDIYLRQSRASDAIFLTLISPEYALQR